MTYGQDTRPCSLESPDPLGGNESKSALYPWLLLAVPLIATPLLILLGKSDFFLHHGASTWVQANDAVFNIRGRNCRVLIFGDSTAMTGIDPSVVQQRTGLPTCNIAVTNAVLSVTGRLPLDAYLAHNARPDVLVVQLSPEGFRRSSANWQDTIYPEGMLELLRHTPRTQWQPFLLHHPQQAFTFAGYVAGFTAWYGLRHILSRTTGIGFESDKLVIQNGFFTPPQPARTQCEPLFKSDLSGLDTAARRIVENYKGSAVTESVLVDVAPIPACDENLLRYQQELAGITTNYLQALPIRYFNDERHFTASGSRILSSRVADQVLSTVHGQGNYPPVTSSTLHIVKNSFPQAWKTTSAVAQ